MVNATVVDTFRRAVTVVICNVWDVIQFVCDMPAVFETISLYLRVNNNFIS